MEDRIKGYMDERAAKGLLRELVEVERRPGGVLVSGGREYVDLSSNDYLGLSFHGSLREAASGIASGQYGSGASRLMTGTTRLHAELELAVAGLKGKDDALVFNSGYQANVGVISSLVSRGDAVFADRLSHASIIDGAMLSGAKLCRFRHNDMGHLEDMLKKERGRASKALIVTESLFSMDGDIAPLPDLVRLKNEHDAVLMVDEAHATGVFGPGGCGVVTSGGLAGQVDVVMGTFSKALGSFGGFVAVSGVMKRYLVNASRSFIYSTSLPPAVIAANLAALELLDKEPERRERLVSLARRLREGLAGRGFTVRGESQIIPVITGSNREAVRVSRELKERGFWALPVRPPTVPDGEARIRISVSSEHDAGTIDALIDAFVKSSGRGTCHG